MCIRDSVFTSPNEKAMRSRLRRALVLLAVGLAPVAVATALPGASVAGVEVGDGASVSFDAVLPPLMNVSAESLSHVTRRLAVINVQPGAGTLQAALNAASAGDELVLADGTYTSSVTNVLDISKSITIRALNPRGAILSSNGVVRA